MGAASAWALTGRGHEVTIYERFEVGHARGSSHGATRVYRYSYPDQRYVGMMKEAMALWRRLEQEAGAEILIRTGGLDTGKDLDAHAAALEAHGVSYELIHGSEVAARWPHLTVPNQEVLVQADGGVVLAEKAWTAFTALALERGARLIEGGRVECLGADGLD